MKHLRAALAGLLSLLMVSAALAQQQNMPYHTLWGRIGAAPGDTGPAQAIPFANLRQALTISGNATTAHIPMFADSTGLQQDSNILQAPTLNGIQFFGIGNNVADAISRWPGNKMPQVVVDRLVNWTAINDNTFADMTTLAPTDNLSLNQYAAYSARNYSTTGFNFDHWAGFEDLPIWSGTGTIDKQRSFLSNPVYNSGTVNFRRGVDIQEVIGAGLTLSDIGVYIQGLTKGSTANWSVFTDGTTPSFFGGSLTIGAVGPPTTTLRSVTLNGGGSGTGAGGSYGVATGGSGSAFGNTSAIHGTAFDATTEIYSSLVAYRFSGLNNGFLLAGSTGLLSTVGFTGTGSVPLSVSPVFTGNPSINAVSPPTGTVSIFTINGGASGTGAGGAFSVNTGASGVAYGTTSGIHGTAFDATAEIYSSLGQYRFSGLSGGSLVAGSTGLLSVAPIPTVTVLTSGTTYTTPAGSTRLYIRMAGGGGGGQGGGSPGASNGGTGGTTTFSGGTLSSTGGVGGASGVGGAGGTSTNCNVKNSTGNTGGTEFQLGTNYNGGFGGAHPFWGGAGASGLGTAINPTAGITNSGGGGAGGGSTVASSAGGGGAAGGGCEHILTGTLASTYTYAIGAAGSPGGAGTSGVAGGAGGSGYIVVEAYGN